VRANVREEVVGMVFAGKVLAVVAAVSAALFAAGCGGSGGGSGEALAEGERIQATTTTTMVTDLVREVGGEEVEVTGLMGPGVDPHLYRASQGDVGALQEADVVFYNGLFLEGRMEDVLEQVGQQKPAVAVTEGIPEERLLESVEYEDQYDPHVWFDVTLWKQAVDPVVEQLSELRPDAAATFERNAEAYKKELDELHAHVEAKMSSIPEERRVLVTAHDAFRYFGRQYGVEVRGLQGISTEAEAGARDVQQLAEYLAENRIPAIFVESSVSAQSIEAVQAAARDRGWDVGIGGQLYSDALGEPGSGADTYVGMVRANVQTIKEALAPERAGAAWGRVA
jgi:manganese/zinc/iron transport system substrate-binding protein